MISKTMIWIISYILAFFLGWLGNWSSWQVFIASAIFSIWLIIS